MKKNNKEITLSFVLILTALFFLTLSPSPSWGKHSTTVAGDFAGGILASRHNLSATSSVIGVVNISDWWSIPTPSEVCVFCHTPHSSERGEGPLWNRSRSSGPVIAYGNTIAENDDGSANMFSSLGCLSCHDGVTTFDTLINRPGKGRNAGDQNWVFMMHPAHTYYSIVWFDGMDSLGSSTCAACHIPTREGPMSSDVIDRLLIGGNPSEGTRTGADLRDDHPIGVVYRGAEDQGASGSLRATSTVISEINLNVQQENGSDLPALVPGNLWAVKGFISDSATIGNLLRTGQGAASDDSRAYVQCSSCHDPHYKNRTNPEKDFYETYTERGQSQMDGGTSVPVASHDEGEVDGLFLRRVGGNSDSGVCRTCHAK